MRLCQLEFYSTDVDESLRFAAAILGWKRVPVAIQDQAVIEVADDSPYGIAIRKRLSGGDSAHSSVTVYFEVEGALAALSEKTLAMGGAIIQEPVAVTGYGQVMIVEDRGGIRYGLYEARFQGPRSKVPAP